MPTPSQTRRLLDQADLAARAPAPAIPFDSVEDLSQFFLWPLLTARQQSETLAIPGRAERHRHFAQALADAGYPLQPPERVTAPDLAAVVAAYLAALDDAEQLHDAGGLTARGHAQTVLGPFLRWCSARAEPEA